MSTFFMVLVISCAILVPIFGWWPLAAAAIITFGWMVLLTDANRKFKPDGETRKKKKRNDVQQETSRDHGSYERCHTCGKLARRKGRMFHCKCGNNWK